MPAAGGRGGNRIVLWSMTLANAIILVDQTAVPLALPSIMKSFNVGSQQVQWVMMGGAAAVAGAFGPTIGGALTALSWRAVLLVNVPLAVVAILGTLRAVRPDEAMEHRPHLDIKGTVLLTVALVSLVSGLSQSQAWGWASPGVLVPLVISVAAILAFLRVEHDSPNPLMDLPLL